VLSVQKAKVMVVAVTTDAEGKLEFLGFMSKRALGGWLDPGLLRIQKRFGV
jgi:hypothetical protein